MQNSQSTPEISLSINIPALATDGSSIRINNDTGDTSLIFFQINPSQTPNPKQLEASAVANVRLSAVQLKQLRESIDTVMTEYEAKKKQP